MAIALYDVSISNYLQTLDAVAGFLERGLAHCREISLDPERLVEAQIHPDMRPFRFQIQSVVFHSVGAIEALKSGTLHFAGQRPAHDYAGLQAIVAAARETLSGVTRDEMAGFEGSDVTLQTGDITRTFTGEGFILSFSLPNFYFHATTAYDILRSQGVTLGKRDYIGALRLKS